VSEVSGLQQTTMKFRSLRPGVRAKSRVKYNCRAIFVVAGVVAEKK